MKFILALMAALVVSPLAAAQSEPARVPDQRVFDGIHAAHERLVAADSRKGPSAFVSGTLLLRDATYRYGEWITYDGSFVNFDSRGCDIFQIVLSVLDGAATLVIAEGNSEGQADDNAFIYSDSLYPESGMFAYTLYSNGDVKWFGILNGDHEGDRRPARVTAFSYCFSTDPFAFDAYFDDEGEMH